MKKYKSSQDHLQSFGVIYLSSMWLFPMQYESSLIPHHVLSFFSRIARHTLQNIVNHRSDSEFWWSHQNNFFASYFSMFVHTIRRKYIWHFSLYIFTSILLNYQLYHVPILFYKFAYVIHYTFIYTNSI